MIELVLPHRGKKPSPDRRRGLGLSPLLFGAVSYHRLSILRLAKIPQVESGICKNRPETRSSQGLARQLQCRARAADGASVVGTYTGSIIVIAEIIERYMSEHPQAVDTAEGIRAWWVAPRFYGASPDDVQGALDYLVEFNRMRQIAIAGGSPVYGRAVRAEKMREANCRSTVRAGSGNDQSDKPSRRRKGK